MVSVSVTPSASQRNTTQPLQNQLTNCKGEIELQATNYSKIVLKI